MKRTGKTVIVIVPGVGRLQGPQNTYSSITFAREILQERVDNRDTWPGEQVIRLPRRLTVGEIRTPEGTRWGIRPKNRHE